MLTLPRGTLRAEAVRRRLSRARRAGEGVGARGAAASAAGRAGAGAGRQDAGGRRRGGTSAGCAAGGSRSRARRRLGRNQCDCGARRRRRGRGSTSAHRPHPLAPAALVPLPAGLTLSSRTHLVFLLATTSPPALARPRLADRTPLDRAHAPRNEPALALAIVVAVRRRAAASGEPAQPRGGAHVCRDGGCEGGGRGEGCGSGRRARGRDRERRRGRGDEVDVVSGRGWASRARVML